MNALSDYAKIYEAETPDFKVAGTWMNEKIDPVRFKDFKEKPVQRKKAFNDELVGKDSSVTLNRTGKGRAYYTTRMRFAYKKVRMDAVNSGLQVSRHYFLKDQSGEWVPQSANVKARRGDLLRIQLQVKIPATRYQVVLADSLPAGFEPLNTALAGTSNVEAKGEGHDSAGSYSWNEDDHWWGFYFNGGFYHREMRLYGAQYFADFLEPGEYEINYIAQAVATGEFNVNPALIEQMYEPEVYGKSTPAKFVVTEK
jgi:uncharacterized protein YfaS (alpha-2-macroglobulin family)